MNGGALHRLARRWPYGLVVLATVVVDQLSKLAIVRSFSYQEVRPVIAGWFDLTYVLNSGGVWGLGSELPGPVRIAIFLALPTIITLFAIWYALSLPLRDWMRHGAVALVVGGAVGNLIDRVRIEKVIDFLSVHWRGEHYWPAFNLADAAICVGIAVLLVLTAFERDPAEPAAPVAPEA